MSSSAKAGKTSVAYQKVVKSPVDALGNGNPLFLGYLVEYLQDRFELPEKLPMVYKSVFRTLEDISKEGEKCIRSWDSPMSPSPEATRLDVEVVAIYTGGEKEQATSIPTMAMVVVRKANPQSASVPSPMMQNFFDESERLILKALDRGLDDFMAGKIPMEDDTTTTPNRQDSLKAAQDAMIEEMLEDAAESHPSIARDEEPSMQQTSSKDNKSMIVDAEFSRVDEESKPKIEEEESKKVTSNRKNSLETEKDFAVEAAKAAAKKRKQLKKPEESVDFAVAAAKSIAKEQQPKKKSVPPKELQKPKKCTKPTSQNAVAAPTNAVLPSSLDIGAINEAMDGRAFRTTFSTPETFAAKMKHPLLSDTKTKKTDSEPMPKKQRASPNNSKQNAEKEDSSKPTDAEAKISNIDETKKKGASAKVVVPPTAPQSEQTAKKGPKRKVNLTVLENDKSKEVLASSSETKKENTKQSSKTTTPTKDKVNNSSSRNKAVPSDQEIMKTAQEVMAELAEQGTDLSAEELLQDVLKFGEKQDLENRVGSGFVNGAFDQAKELLREQKKQRDERIRDKVAQQVVKDMASKKVPTTDETSSNTGPKVKTRVITSEEEELKRMFEAGERIADGRIALAEEEKSTSTPTKANPYVMTDEDQQELEELIASEKGVSDHARIIDDELAELEVRINQSPGEELDGPSTGNLFDILSGPEVYNPNVDPETAVNWPGALPGTRSGVERTLPKELSEAVKQAEFAAAVLQKMEVKKASDSDTKTYVVGNREMSQEQIESLQTVVQEAVEIGIIPNPLVLMEERSRLQMVLDELWDQPQERWREIVSNYKELLISDNFVALIKERLEQMAERDLESLRHRTDDDEKDIELEKTHARERELLGQMVVNAQLLLKEARALGAELEAQQIEVIRSICKVAMDPSHSTEEETAVALTDAVRDMRPLFDDMFVSYLKYAVAEEEGRLARAGLLDDPEHTQWLFVLKIVQQGVHAEIAKGINRYIEHIWYVLRMETAVERKMLLEKLVDAMPTLDVRPFVRVVDNIVGSLGEAVKGEFDGAYELGKMTNKLLQLHRDLKEMLPPEKIDEMSRDADEWAAKRKERLMKQRRLTKQRLKAARDTEQYDDEIEIMGRRGEMERFD